MTIRTKLCPLGGSLRDSYAPGTILFESATAQTTALNLKKGIYRLTITGGGGGCSNPSKHSTTASGGSAAGFIGEIRLKEGDYTVIVGASGPGTNNGGGFGGTSSLAQGSVILIGCQGGEVGYLDTRGGAGGTLNVSETLDICSFTVKSNGNPGQGWYGGGGPGGVSVLSGTADGYGAGTYGGWTGSLAGKPGYIKLEYLRIR